MKKNNGFTLIELLAVLIILAVIALIVFPMIGDVITDSKMKAFRSSVDGLEHAVSLDYQKDYYKGVREYQYENGNLTLLSVKGETKNTNIKVEGMIENGVGTLSVDKDGNTSLIVYNDEWCAVKDFTDKTVTVEEKTEDNCVVPTPSYCFEFNESTGTITDYYCHGENEYGYETITDVVIPSKINGKSILEIGSFVFQSKRLTNVILPSSINLIGKASFSDNNIKSVIIPSSVTAIGQFAFACNPNLEVTYEDPNNLPILGTGVFDPDECPM